MKKIIIAIFVAVFLFLLNLRQIQAQTSDKIVVVFKSPPRASMLLSVAKTDSRVSQSYGISDSQAQVYTVFDMNTKEAIASLSANENVQAVFPDYKLKMMVIPNDMAIQTTPLPGRPRIQWNMFQLNLAGAGRSAWDISKGEPSVITTVIDAGVDSSHPDLAGKFSSLVDCAGSSCRQVSSMSEGSISDGHGTHVAGLLAAATNNSLGVAGSGYNTRLMVIKIMDASNEMRFSYLVNALRWAGDHGAKVVNMSLGIAVDNMNSDAIALLNQAIQYVWDKGAFLVAAAGNCAGQTTGNTECAIYDNNGNIAGYVQNSKIYPAASPNVLSVAALTVENTLASYSQHNDPNQTAIGNWISVAAPGGYCLGANDAYNCIVSTIPEGQYAYMAGTSMASPQVAGIAALMRAVNTQLTNDQIKNIIETTANHSIATGVTNFGAVDGLAALSALTPSPTSRPSPTVAVTPTGAITLTPSVTPTLTPTLSPTAYPTISAKLPKTPPDPYPSPPYCANIVNCPQKPKGDVNCDGKIDIADYILWKQEYDRMVPPVPDNYNANFVCREGNDKSYFVDLIDFEVWRKNAASGL